MESSHHLLWSEPLWTLQMEIETVALIPSWMQPKEQKQKRGQEIFRCSSMLLFFKSTCELMSPFFGVWDQSLVISKPYTIFSLSSIEWTIFFTVPPLKSTRKLKKQECCPTLEIDSLSATFTLSYTLFSNLFFFHLYQLLCFWNCLDNANQVMSSTTKCSQKGKRWSKAESRTSLRTAIYTLE